MNLSLALGFAGFAVGVLGAILGALALAKDAKLPWKWAVLVTSVAVIVGSIVLVVAAEPDPVAGPDTAPSYTLENLPSPTAEKNTTPGPEPTLAPQPITDVRIDGSTSGTVVNFTVFANPNGTPATVTVTSSGGTNTTFGTGVAADSWAFNDNVGYSTTDTVNVSVSSPGRTTVTASNSWTTGGQPAPARAVTVSKGSSASSHGCSCNYIVITMNNFAPGIRYDVYCYTSGPAGGSGMFDNMPVHITTDGSGNGQSTNSCWYGYGGQSVWAIIDGVESNHLVW